MVIYYFFTIFIFVNFLIVYILFIFSLVIEFCWVNLIPKSLWLWWFLLPGNIAWPFNNCSENSKRRNSWRNAVKTSWTAQFNIQCSWSISCGFSPGKLCIILMDYIFLNAFCVSKVCIKFFCIISIWLNIKLIILTKMF